MEGSRVRRAAQTTKARAESVSQRGQQWVESQHPASYRGVGIDAWRRYRDVDGPLQSALLSLYLLVAVIPALLVLVEYLDRHPGALAEHLVRHYHLDHPTAQLVRNVLVQDHTHEFGTALIAIASALFFGLGFGRVLQLVHGRAWRLTLPKKGADTLRFGVVLLGLYGAIALLLIQLAELSGDATWVGYLLVLPWLALLTLFFTWAPRYLSHGLLAWRDLLPSGVLTAVGLTVLMVVSRFVMQFWINFYAADYGGFGVVMAMFFWIAFASGLIVWAAAISPALARRRAFRLTAAS
jgi:membrane protein